MENIELETLYQIGIDMLNDIFDGNLTDNKDDSELDQEDISENEQEEEELDCLDIVLDFLLGETDEYDEIFKQYGLPLIDRSFNYYRNFMMIIVFSTYYLYDLYDVKIGINFATDPIFKKLKNYKDVLQFFKKSSNREKLISILDVFF